MSATSHTELAIRPVLCFGLVPVVGVLGFVLTGNGFSFFGFLLAYIPFCLVISVVGAVFAAKAYAGLPSDHWGRIALAASIALAILGVLLGCLVFIGVGNAFSY